MQLFLAACYLFISGMASANKKNLHANSQQIMHVGTDYGGWAC